MVCQQELFNIELGVKVRQEKKTFPGKGCGGVCGEAQWGAGVGQIRCKCCEGNRGIENGFGRVCRSGLGGWAYDC